MRFLSLAVAALALAVPVTAAGQAERVTVTMTNFNFAPEALHLDAGRSATIHFVNNGSGGHDFTAPEFFAAATMDAANRAKVGGARGASRWAKARASTSC